MDPKLRKAGVVAAVRDNKHQQRGIYHQAMFIILTNQTTSGVVAEFIFVIDAIGSLAPLNGAIVGAFIGAIVTSGASEVLTTYRNDLNKARRFDAIVEHIELVTDKDISDYKKETMMKEIEQELREFYIEEQWLLTDDGRDTAREIIRDISGYTSDDSSGNNRKISQVTDSLNSKSDDLRDGRLHVKLRHAWRRYLGRRDAYSGGYVSKIVSSVRQLGD